MLIVNLIPFTYTLTLCNCTHTLIAKFSFCIETRMYSANCEEVEDIAPFRFVDSLIKQTTEEAVRGIYLFATEMGTFLNDCEKRC